MTQSPRTVTVSFGSYLEPEHAERIRGVSDRLRVVYEPELLAPPRFHADHTGDPSFERTPEQEARFREVLAQAEVLFDFDRALAPRLPELAPNLRWVQATSSGIGQLVKEAGLQDSGILITNAAGIHAVPLAEHTLLSLLYFVKDVPARLRDQQAQVWEPYAGRELSGMTVAIVGLGAVGLEVAKLCKAVGMRVIGVRRTPVQDLHGLPVDEMATPDELHGILPQSDAIVLIVPHTPESEGMMGAAEFSLMRPGAILVNIGRGALVQEDALVEALRSGHLGGAALDVTVTEPLPAGHPLWSLPNVLITPHSASTVDRENGRLTDLFCENLRRYLAGEKLVNEFAL